MVFNHHSNEQYLETKAGEHHVYRYTLRASHFSSYLKVNKFENKYDAYYRTNEKQKKAKRLF